MTQTKPSMNAREIHNNVRAWADADDENRTSLLILREEFDGYSQCNIQFSATEPEMSKMIATFMAKDKDMARAIFIAALSYAKREMTAKELSEINDRCDAAMALNKARNSGGDRKETEA